MSVRNSDMENLSRKEPVEIQDDIEFQDDDLAGDLETADELSDTTILEADSELSDNVGYSSVQIDVAQLLAEVEAEASKGVDASGRVRRRLEAIMERKRRHQDLLDFEDYDLDS